MKQKQALLTILSFICCFYLNSAQAMAMNSSETTINSDINTNGTLSTLDDTSNTDIKKITVVGLVQNLDVSKNIIVVDNTSYILPEKSHLHLDKTLRIRSVVKMLVENNQVVDLWILR